MYCVPLVLHNVLRACSPLAFFVCTPKWISYILIFQIVTSTLASQSIDSNALLGASTLSYRYHFWDGAVIPIGLGISLILNSIFLARHINVDYAFTLPDVFAKRYGKVVEVMASLCSVVSFLCLLAGNLVGMAAIISYCLGISQKGAIWVSLSSTYQSHNMMDLISLYCIYAPL